MTTLLEEIQNEIELLFDKYETTQHIPSEFNAECMTHIRNIVNQSNYAFAVIKTLPDQIKKLEARFWGFLPFVQDPVRDLKEGLEKLLQLKKYQQMNVLVTESIELRLENTSLRNRLEVVENKFLISKKIDVDNNLLSIQPLKELCSEVAEEVQQEINFLQTELAKERQQNVRLQEASKRLLLKAEAYQKQMRDLVVSKEKMQHEFVELQAELATTKCMLQETQTELIHLADENKRLKQLLNSEGEKNKINSIGSSGSYELEENFKPNSVRKIGAHV